MYDFVYSVCLTLQQLGDPVCPVLLFSCMFHESLE